jgi:hypothetical protein
MLEKTSGTDFCGVKHNNNHQKKTKYKKVTTLQCKGVQELQKPNHQTLHNPIPKHPKNTIVVCFFIISRVQR